MQIVFNPFTNNFDFIGGSSGPGSGAIFTINEISPDGDGNFTLESSSGAITFTPITNGLDLNLASAGIVWSDKSGSFPALAGNGYFCTAALTAALPVSPNNGDTIEFITTTASTVLILANTGQTIYNGSASSSVGGTLSASAIGNSLELIYRSTDQSWRSLSVNGTWGIA